MGSFYDYGTWDRKLERYICDTFAIHLRYMLDTGAILLFVSGTSEHAPPAVLP